MSMSFVGSRDFVHRTSPRHSTRGSKQSRSSSVHSPDRRLSIIEEDGFTPPIPPRAHHRPFNRRWHLGDPPRHSFDIPPPQYSSVWNTTGPKGEKLLDVRNNKYIAPRGGLKRICLALFILVALIVGLAVGLIIGLRKRHSSSHSAQPSEDTTSNSGNGTAPFPAGSYTLTSVLNTIKTDCSSEPSYWTCWPYHTYLADPTEAVTNITYDIIAEEDGFVISGSYFQISFSNVSLIMVDPGTDSERYIFNTSTEKVTPLGGKYCYFDHTVVVGNLYTKKSRTYPPASASNATISASAFMANSSSSKYQPWPFAGDMTQSINGGSAVPECYKMDDGRKTDRIMDGIVPKAATDHCSCEYKNFDI
ncbi:MAG: hypothetical protein Q9214_003230 [Letrouitia sp. 1 TL-2023]